MPTLQSKDRNLTLLADLRVASSLWARMKGLIGCKELSREQALWIVDCHSIHTFFMSFAIDCVFVSRENKIVSILEDVKPYRLTWRQHRAYSVVEMPAGRARELNFKLGEQLHVGP